MSQSNLSKWLKFITIGVALCLAIVYFFVIPELGTSLASQYPEFAFCYLPWLIFLVLTSIPCYTALVYGWKIAVEISRDNSFSYANSASLRMIALLALIDSAYFFIGNIVFLLLNMSHFGILLLSFLVDTIGIAIAVISAALSHMVYKSAKLKEENDLTI